MEAAEYRPISLTSHLMKTGERVIRKKLVNYLEFYKKMDPKQHGSREKRSTLSQLLVHYDEMKAVKSAAYLGDILNEDGNIDDTVLARKDRSIGRISQIMSILDSISLGMFYMDISLILRESMLLNGTI